MGGAFTREDESVESVWLSAAVHTPAFDDLNDFAEDLYSLADGQPLHLETEPTPIDLLAMAREVYEGLSDDEAEDIERIALDRRTFFTER